MLFSGLFDLPWWGHVVAALALTHVTIAAVTIYLHRCQAHRALDLHPAVSHFFRLWLWLTTGMVTKEWAAVHRKHHAKCETPEDPHSPQVYGINRVLWLGVVLYVKECAKPETLERYGRGTPDDWIERNVYSKLAIYGVFITLAADLVLFGAIPGALIWLTQMAWIPFWAAGVINGVGHYWGYRHWPTPDASTNIVPWGILIGGEELHNNHHAYPTSAKLSSKWYELDAGWLYIRILEALGLATVKHVAPTPRFTAPKPAVDPNTLEAVIRYRYDVLARYARMLHELERARLAQVLPKLRTLQTMYSMRHELAAVWGRSKASREQLVRQLQDWCARAEASGIRSLAEFSQRLRSYA
jgi:stearoyl-CoA desaturase (Delta-9 desaturase)